MYNKESYQACYRDRNNLAIYLSDWALTCLYDIGDQGCLNRGISPKAREKWYLALEKGKLPMVDKRGREKQYKDLAEFEAYLLSCFKLELDAHEDMTV